MQERSSQDPAGSGGKMNENVTRTSKAEAENPSRKPHPAQKITGRHIGTNSMEDMPCVFTKGDGPNGRRIEGILYKYGKREEVRIMCVCHEIPVCTNKLILSLLLVEPNSMNKYQQVQ